MRCLVLVVLCLAAVAGQSSADGACPLGVSVQDDGELTVSVNDAPWFAGGRIAVKIGEWTSTDDKSLVPKSKPQRDSGADALGSFTSTRLEFQAGLDTPFVVVVKSYNATDGDFCGLVFEQSFPDGAQFTATSQNLDTARGTVMSAFPSLAPLGDEKGYVAYYDQMLGGMDQGTRFGRFVRGASLVDGPSAGPYVVFDRQMQNSVVVGAWDNPMACNVQQHDGSGNLEFGLVGTIASIPTAFMASTAMVWAPSVTESVMAFGSALLKKNGKPVPPSDITLEKLGYSTDNGAYYYYNTVANSTYQQTIVDVQDYLATEGIPVQYVLLDSWWYYRGASDGVTNWTPRPDVFPDGLEWLYNATGWPVQAHNRYWDEAAVYARSNGGSYDFIVDGKYSSPVGVQFWSDLLNKPEWGLVVYEQDWLHNQWTNVPALQQSATLSRSWLRDMGKGAKAANITIQYCMPWTRHGLASTEVEMVNQVRASDDFKVDLAWDHGEPVNLMLGVSSLLSHALALKPSKDVFWTTSVQPFNQKYGNVTARFPEAHTAVATFSTGPVAIGDAIGFVNKTLVMRTCMQDGTLLQPSLPMIAINEQFTARAFGEGGPDGEVWATRSVVGEWEWGHAIAMQLKSPYTLSLGSLPVRNTTSTVAYARDWDSFAFVDVAESSTWHLPALDLPRFSLVHSAPLFSNGWALLGEVDKWVPVSPQRVVSVSVQQSGVQVTVRGQKREAVGLMFVHKDGSEWDSVVVECKIGDGGVAVVSTPGLVERTEARALVPNVAPSCTTAWGRFH